MTEPHDAHYSRDFPCINVHQNKYGEQHSANEFVISDTKMNNNLMTNIKGDCITKSHSNHLIFLSDNKDCRTICLHWLPQIRISIVYAEKRDTCIS